MPKPIRFLLPLVLLYVVVSLSLVPGCDWLLKPPPQAAAPTPAPQSMPPEFDKLWQVWHVLSKGYVDKEALDPDKLSLGAIRGMLDALGDPYTAYMDSVHYQAWLTTFQGNYEGIGVEITKLGELIAVVTSFDGSPAQRAGIRAGDIILEVDGQPTTGMSVMDAALKVKGPKGTVVRLLLFHPGGEMPAELEIVRDRIELVSASYRRLDGLGYIRLGRFSENTAQELEPLLRQARSEGVSGLILDLRDNSGGYLDVTVEVASQFLTSGIVYSQLERDGTKTSQPVKAGGLATDLPLVVLVNKGSASASEVLAGALQDHGRAPLIGTATFGKGSANTIVAIEGGGALYYTISRWLTPRGRLIEGQGLTPDIVVEPTEEDMKQGRDPQLQRAIEYLEARSKAATTS